LNITDPSQISDMSDFLMPIETELNKFAAFVGLPRAGCLGNGGGGQSGSCSTTNITPTGTNAPTIVQQGNNTLDWHNKIQIPPDTPCGTYILNIQWSQPVYKKGAGYAPAETDTGETNLFIRVGQIGHCGSAGSGTVYASQPPVASLCSLGRASNIFSIGNFWKWTCDSADVCGIADTQCQAPKNVIVASCGSNGDGTSTGRVYGSSETSFKGTFCIASDGSKINPNPSNPPFPTASNPTTWTCPNGSSSVTCKATLTPGGSCQ
jgi:hypothetical protein